ncbi:uncharacterized protein [Apostichopus japonicus]|uniref:uncharacterized protein isoform X2 n=1 Tax=Stichopus japonicus TaxID=307972 RepID=UPI003AB31024
MSKGPSPYDDVYLDEQHSSDDGEGGMTESSTKPLMSSRKSKKAKIQVRHPGPKTAIYYRRKRCLLKLFYLLLGLISVSLFVFVLIKVIADALQSLAQEGPERILPGGTRIDEEEELVPCSGFDVELVWMKNFPTLTTETAVRMMDVNRDGILDAILGFGTMAYGLFGDQYLLCQIYYDNQLPCFGGLLALDGNTGDELWRHYSNAEIFAVNCEEDIDKDGVKDCLGAGRAGQFELINGASGDQMWTFENNELVREYVSNLYTPQYIEDIDGDDVPDVINIHGGDPVRATDEKVKAIAKLVVFSGRTGDILVWSEVPDKQESYYSPQVYSKGDGTKMILFGTGGETHGGCLFVISLADVLEGSLIKAKVIYRNAIKGVMTPPVLVDLTKDGVVDIVSVPFNGTVLAIDGETYDIIWNTTVPFSESYSTPGAGYYNDDDVPDFMIIFNYGPGYPLYYYSQVTILDGQNGKPLLDPPMKMSGSVQSSSLSVSFEGHGNDAFIYWGLMCAGHEQDTSEFKYAKVTGGSKSRVNFCKERFGTDDVTRQFILNRNMNIPGDVMYDSSQYFDFEHSSPVNATILAVKFLKTHPNIKDKVIKEALQRHHGAGNQDLQKPSKKENHVTPSHSMDDDDSDEISELNDDDLLNKFLSYLRENFDDEEKKLMIQQLLKDGGYQLDEDGDLDIGDFVFQSAPDDTDFGERQLFNDYSPLDHSKKNSVTSRQDKKNSYPQSLEDFYYNRRHQDDGAYRRPYQRERRKRNPEKEPLNQPRDEYLHENIERLLEESQFLGRESSSTSNRRRRRHLGAHDADGVQRLISTGSLAPPLDAESVRRGDSIDVVFAVYWFYPSEDHLILPEEEDCIKQYMDNELQRMNPENQFYGLDHDGFINHVEDICLSSGNEEKMRKHTENLDPLNIYPFNLDAGILTVYRLRLKCDCDLSPSLNSSARRCAKMLPYHRQRWPAYLGRHTNSFFHQ